MIFFIDTIIFFISSTQIACDVICVQYVQKQPTKVFFKKGILKNFANLTGKHMCWSLFLIKLQAWGPVTLLKRDSNTDVFLWNYQNLTNTYFEEHLRMAADQMICNKILLEKIRAVFRI